VRFLIRLEQTTDDVIVPQKAAQRGSPYYYQGLRPLTQKPPPLTPRLTFQVNVTGFFPDDFVESPSLFKHNGYYYVTYGSCCCGCSQGGGIVVFMSKSVNGPWTRQEHADINCRNSSAKVCGGYSLRYENLADLVYNAQWWGPSFIPVNVNGTVETRVIFLGRRWLSGPNLPPGCHDICGNQGKSELCIKGGGEYFLKSDYSVWYPLDFDDDTGQILPLVPLDSFELDLAAAPAPPCKTLPGSTRTRTRPGPPTPRAHPAP